MKSIAQWNRKTLKGIEQFARNIKLEWATTYPETKVIVWMEADGRLYYSWTRRGAGDPPEVRS